MCKGKKIQSVECTLYLVLVLKHHSQHLKDLKASYVQDANERCPLTFGPVQGLVNAVDEPSEQPLICCLGQGFNSKVSLREKQRAQNQRE